MKTAYKNGILLPESLVSGCHFAFLPLGICVDFQKCVDFWFQLKKCVDLRRFFSFVGLYQSWQGFSVTRATLIQRNINKTCKSRGFSTLVISFLLV